MAVEFQKSCDIGQGYDFKPDEHHTFGYIKTFALGDNNIAPDIKVVDPAATPTGQSPGNPETAGIFTYPVFAVLEQVSWSTLPNDNITLKARISLPNAMQLNMLAMQSLKKVIVTLSFVVYQYDLVNQTYFTSFLSYKGVTPPRDGSGGPGGFGGFGNDGVGAPISALLAKISGTEFGLKVGAAAQEDPLGIHNYTLELTLAPPIVNTPQQLLIQTSTTVKLIQPWGVPK